MSPTIRVLSQRSAAQIGLLYDWTLRTSQPWRQHLSTAPIVLVAIDKIRTVRGAPGSTAAPDCLREADLPADLFEYLHNIGAAESQPRFDRGREAGERVKDREHPQLAAARKLIMDEVRRPGLVVVWRQSASGS